MSNFVGSFEREQPPLPTRRRPTARTFVGLGLAAGTLLAASACSPSKDLQNDPDTAPVFATSSAATAPEPTNSPMEPPIIPLENCLWEDTDGKRQPLLKKNPVTVAVWGKCFSSPTSAVGIYPEPRQSGASVDQVGNGTPLTVECYDPEGQSRQDGMSDQSKAHSSNTWLKVTNPATKAEGFIPYIWTGFSGAADAGVDPCSN